MDKDTKPERVKGEPEGETRDETPERWWNFDGFLLLVRAGFVFCSGLILFVLFSLFEAIMENPPSHIRSDWNGLVPGFIDLFNGFNPIWTLLVLIVVWGAFESFYPLLNRKKSSPGADQLPEKSTPMPKEVESDDPSKSLEKRISALEERVEELKTGQLSGSEVPSGIKPVLNSLEDHHEKTAKLVEDFFRQANELIKQISRKAESSLTEDTGRGLRPALAESVKNNSSPESTGAGKVKEAEKGNARRLIEELNNDMELFKELFNSWNRAIQEFYKKTGFKGGKVKEAETEFKETFTKDRSIIFLGKVGVRQDINSQELSLTEESGEKKLFLFGTKTSLQYKGSGTGYKFLVYPYFSAIFDKKMELFFDYDPLWGRKDLIDLPQEQELEKLIPAYLPSTKDFLPKEIRKGKIE